MKRISEGWLIHDRFGSTVVGVFLAERRVLGPSGSKAEVRGDDQILAIFSDDNGRERRGECVAVALDDPFVFGCAALDGGVVGNFEFDLFSILIVIFPLVTKAHARESLRDFVDWIG